MFTWLLLLIIYLPFQIALNPRVGFDLASLRVFIVLLFIVCLKKIWQYRFQICNLQAVGLFLFLILAGFSLIGAQNIFWGLRKMIFFLSIFPLYFLIVALVDNWLKVKKVILILVGSSSLVALIGLGQFLFQFIFGLEGIYSFWAINILPVFSGFNLGSMILAYPSWLVNMSGQTIMRAFSLFSDPHMFSFYLGLILPLMIVFFRSWIPRRTSKKIAFFILFFLLFVVLLLTFTRGAYLAIIVTFLVLAVLTWKYLRIKKIALFLFLSLLIFIIPITPISDRFYSSFDLSEGSNVGRLEMWQQAGETGLEHFWSGVGLGNYSLTVDSILGYRNPITAHNLYLDIFSEIGIFALAVWLVLILGTISCLFQIIRNTKDDNVKYLSVSLIGSLVYFLAHSFFETAVYNPIILALLMVILGLSSRVLIYAQKDN
jgi:O-antigen ligase